MRVLKRELMENRYKTEATKKISLSPSHCTALSLRMRRTEEDCREAEVNP